MSVGLLLLVTVALLGYGPLVVKAAGAGRAFPVDAENFAIENFQRVNPKLEWDPTNFMTDLSGNYANCNYLNQKGEVQADRKTPEGYPVTIAIDTIEGRDSDVDHVIVYVKDVIRRWMNNRQFHGQITKSHRVGCSVRPACSGYAVIACAFSYGSPEKIIVTQPPPVWTYPTRRPIETTKQPEDQPEKEWWLHEKPKALAFTADQYKVAESVMGKQWDRSHFLENLSGFETDCSMIGRNDWPFEHMKKMSRQQNMKITGQYGVADNKGSTPEALSEILRQFKQVTNVKSIGCSIIPHCHTSASSMKVVVSCLFEEH